MYRRAPSVDALPWHRESPPALLVQAAAGRRRGDRCLDVGCGEGVNATYLAEQGLRVLGIDFVPAALAAARERASRAGAEIELHDGDVLDYVAPTPVDRVVDSGCLHHIPKAAVERYRARLDQWLAPGGDYVLVHFANPPRVRWLPKGPSHLTRERAVELFALLQLRAYDEVVYDVAFPMGSMRAGVYWFTRPA
jgi:cyclopropane fatty-acyl-phospholipid synthase-like methyltransferase